MLKIKNKIEILPKSTPTEIKSQKQHDEKIHNNLNSDKPYNSAEIYALYQHMPSISSETLAHFIQHITNALNELNYKQSLHTILFLYGLPHQQRELRYLLKSKYKIDPVLLLLLLLQNKNHPIAISFASLIIDTFTLSLMLNGKHVILLWKKYISRSLLELEAQEEILFTINQTQTQKKQGFKNIKIPL